MAGEIYHNYLTNKTLYAIVFATSGQVYLTDATGPEVWGAGGHDADDYDITMTETNVGNSQHYIGNFNASFAAGVYRVTIYEQAGANPADGDKLLAHGIMYWDGTAELNPYTLNTQIEDDIIGADGDTLEDLSNQIDILSSQKSQILNIYDDRK